MQISLPEGFLRRHAMSACVALYIDALHDAANGIDPTVTDEKLSGVPVALSIFKAAEEAPIEGVREVRDECISPSTEDIGKSADTT